MQEKKIQAIVLAAGKSTRLNSGNTKLLERICGQPMILYSTSLLAHFHIPTTVVIGFQGSKIKKAITDHHHDTISFVTQDKQHGTGHAVQCTRSAWKKDDILIINGDAPLVTEQIIAQLIEKHREQNATISFVTAYNADPSFEGYGRVITQDNKIQIIEAKDFDGNLQEQHWVNAGIYLVKRSFLEQHIDQLIPRKNGEEFYITDLVKIASENNLTVATTIAPFDRIRGINTFRELWTAEQIKRAEIISYWMDHGVRFSGAPNLHIDLDVEIGAGTYIGCGVHLLRGTKIGKHCKIHELTSLENAIIEDNVEVFPNTIIKDSVIGAGAQVGPFAHVLEHSIVKENAILGNFIEVKRSVVGAGAKAKHLTYLGDAVVGANANLGAGTITCNYDGSTKHKTIIEEGAFIGSNNTLVAPVIIGKESFTAAGSVITENVPANAMAFGRARQVNKEGYAQKIRDERMQQQKNNAKLATEDQKKTFVAAKKTSKKALTEHS